MIRSPNLEVIAALAAAIATVDGARAGAVAGVEQALARIAAEDTRGPQLHAVITLAPDALDQARRLDAASVPPASSRPLPPPRSDAGETPALRNGAGDSLRGAPILVKDNIETADMATTAGSLALKDDATGRDAPLVARLRAAGAIVLGKTNLSEWANFRSTHSISGWSAVGGQTRNPRDPARNPCGSSSGSGAAVAAGYVRIAIGTETDGSITCPASVNGVVGLKPTVGLVSRAGIVPISAAQDTAGPIAASVREAAQVLTVIAGGDPADPATSEADSHRADYAAGLDAGALKGARIGVMRFAAGFHPETDAVFDAALARMRAAGATLVEIAAGPGGKALDDAEQAALLTEFKAGLNAWLATTPASVKTRTLADLIAFDEANAAREMPLFGQELFVDAQKTKGTDDPAYRAARALALRLARAEGIDKMLREANVVALVAPTAAPAWLTDPILKDQALGGAAGQLAAIAGYPHLTVPMGAVRGMPVGLSFIGPAWSEARLLSLGYAFERARGGK